MEENLKNRVHAIDALRGFDMFWIIGADDFFAALLGFVGASWSLQLSEQLEHVAWQGFRFYDLIFPLFLFLVGCALPFSLEKYRSQPSDVYWRIGRRVLSLFLLGLVANGLMRLEWSELRYAGVLQRIGICYGVAALIYLHTRWQSQALVCAAILMGYWFILRWIPAPGGMAGDLSIEGNLAGWIDRQVLPGKILPAYYGYGDNEGILSTLPSVATVLTGVLAAHGLRSNLSPWAKVSSLLLAGAFCIGLGYFWDGWFPIIKNLWTSSFVLLSTGWSLVLLALFYAIIDVMGYQKWAFFFTIIGVNAITIYIAQRFIDFEFTADYFLSGIARILGDLGPTIVLAGVLGAKILFLWLLYRHRIFLRV
jgi:predicted acyltransferase